MIPRHPVTEQDIAALEFYAVLAEVSPGTFAIATELIPARDVYEPMICVDFADVPDLIVRARGLRADNPGRRIFVQRFTGAEVIEEIGHG